MNDFVDSYAPIDSDPVTDDPWPRPSPFYWNPPKPWWQRLWVWLVGENHE